MNDQNSDKSSNRIDAEHANKILDKTKFLWEEYKYRHELCWKLIFQLTAAVVIILIIPYTKTDIAKAIKYWIICLPMIAISLLIFAFNRFDRELELLTLVRTKYRELQTSLYGITHKQHKGRFTRDVKLYLIALSLLCIADIIALIFSWIPNLPR